MAAHAAAMRRSERPPVARNLSNANRERTTNKMNSGLVRATAKGLARDTDSTHTQPAQMTRRRERTLHRSHIVDAKMVNPNVAAFRYPEAGTASSLKIPRKASARGKRGAAPS